MAAVDSESLLKLPIAERLVLAIRLWDSIAADEAQLADSPDVVEEMERRLDAYLRDPSTARPWEEVRDELMRRFR